MTALTATAGALKIFVYGSEYKKGTTDADIKSVTPSFTQYLILQSLSKRNMLSLDLILLKLDGLKLLLKMEHLDTYGI
jgi:hypothetical protein